MHVSPYYREGIVYIPTSMQIPGSYYIQTEPVRIIPVSDIVALVEAIESAILAGNPSVTEQEAPALPNWVTLARTGVRSWRAFDKGALTWSLISDWKTGKYHMHSFDPLKGGGRTMARIPIFTLPADTPISEVARRTAEVVRDAAELQSRQTP